ncbi:LOW QUALITY PROTEIN: ovoperoxidase, partial [Kutzneria sp. 744]
MTTTKHGFEIRGLDVPRGAAPPTGRFGRMFPTLPARPATGLPLAERLGLPGGLMDGGDTTTQQDSPTLDAGFTFLGQFIDHNITFDATGNLGRQVDPEATTNFRPPMLDLDHLYGSGPFASPLLYDTRWHNTKLLVSPDGVDLARTAGGVALIGDPRNDENLLLNQVHLAFIKFHNRVVDGLMSGEITDVFGNRFPPPPADPNPNPPANASIADLLSVRTYWDDLFAAAQQVVRWHYQWIIVHEYLPLVCGQDSVDTIDRDGLQFFDPAGNPFIPVEFAVAGFRFMHPTIRSDYTINDKHTLPLFPLNFDDPAPEDPHDRADLRGGAVAPEFALDFRHFFTIDGSRPQRAKRIEAKLNVRLLDLPPITDVPAEIGRQLRSLVVRNLLRSEVQQLPSGQDISRKIGQVPLTEAELGISGPAYLWYYILSRPSCATVAAGWARSARHRQRGADRPAGRGPDSYRSTYPIWTPTLAEQRGPVRHGRAAPLSPAWSRTEGPGHG